MLAIAMMVVFGLWQESNPGPAPDKVYSVELSTGEDGAVSRIEWRSEFEGSLHMWANSEDFDPVLFVTNQDTGENWTVDDSGCGSTAALMLGMGRGTSLILEVRASGGLGGIGELHVVCSPQTEQTRRVAGAANMRSREVRAMVSRGDFDEASRAIDEVLRELEEVPGGDRCTQVANALARVGSAALRARDHANARRALERALEYRLRINPPKHPVVLSTQSNLAVAFKGLGNLPKALELLQHVMAVRDLNLPPDHRGRPLTQGRLANVLHRMGRESEALALREEAFEVVRESFADDDDLRITTSQNLAISFKAAGRFEDTLALQRALLDALSQDTPATDLRFLSLRENEANTLNEIGDFEGARHILEDVLEIRTELFPDGHSSLESTWNNLGLALVQLGDADRARVLSERVLAARLSRLPENHSKVLSSRMNLGSVFCEMQEWDRAVLHLEPVFLVLESEQPDSSLARQAAINLAEALRGTGELERARELQEWALARLLTNESDSESPLVHRYRMNLAYTLKLQGELDACRELQKEALGVYRGIYAAGHPMLVSSQQNLAWTHLALGEYPQSMALARSLASELCTNVEGEAKQRSIREVEGRIQELKHSIATILSLANGAGVTDDVDAALVGDSFVTIETLRGLTQVAARSVHELVGETSTKNRLTEASAHLARLALADEPKGLSEAIFERDRAQRDLLALARERDAEWTIDASAETLSKRLTNGEVFVGYWAYLRKELDPDSRQQSLSRWELLAHVLDADGHVQRVDLGPLEPIRNAVRDWRLAILGSAEGGTPSTREERQARGSAIHDLIWSPLADHLEGARRAIVAPDDALHLVPFDALPTESGVVGDELQVSVRTTFLELPQAEQRAGAKSFLVTVGDVDFDAGMAPSPMVASARSPEASPRWSSLPGTRDEARAVQVLHDGHFGDAGESVFLSGVKATKHAVLGHVPGARFLHVATHGYFAPDSMRSTHDIDLQLEGGAHRLFTQDERVRGMSPLVLSGLVFAGANRGPSLHENLSGVITAEELAALDLTECELAVLSACETGVGLRRPGLGLASLQRALHAAGARAAITSLWKVDDAATRELFQHFYAGFWNEGRSKVDALWEAKMAMRRKRAPLREWAGWVLTGDSR